MDVAEMFRECEVNKDCGFHIQAENVSGKKAYLVAKDENGKKGSLPDWYFKGRTL